MKLKQIIVTLFVILSVAPLLFLGVIDMYYNDRKLETILENDLRVAASIEVKAIDNFYEERAADSDVLVHSLSAHELLLSEDPQHMEALRRSVNSELRLRTDHNRFVESVTILNRDYVVVACSQPEAVGEVSTLKNLDPAYLSAEMRFTPVVERVSKGNGQKVIAAVQEIDNGGTPVGYVVQELNLSFFEEVRSSAALFNNGTIYILDSNGQMIAAGDAQSTRDNYELTPGERDDYLRAWENRDPNARSGILRYKARGQRYMTYYSDFEFTDWRMLSSVCVDEVLQTGETLRRLAMLIVAELAVLLAAVRFIVSRSIARPIGHMLKKFQHIRDSGDYSCRMDDLGKNELGVISREINALLTHVESSITRQQQKQDQLRRQAQRDPLTGLFNKEAIGQLLRLELDKGTACLFVDVDDFKEFNTRYGHMGGDRVLCFIAETLSDFSGGIAGRQGGDEFVAFLRNLPDRAALEKTIQALLDTLNRGVTLEDGGAPVPVPCSIGAVLTDGGAGYEEMVELADRAMYEIKHGGKNGFCVLERGV